MVKNLFKKGRICIDYIPNFLVFGISYDKPHLFIILGIIYIEIDLKKSPKKKRFEKKIPPTNDYFYYHDSNDNHYDY